ncbi:MAG: cystathionine beta-synthase [Thermomicrobiales bacterium]
MSQSGPIAAESRTASAPNVHETVLDEIGSTPLVRLQRVGKGTRTPIWAKLEMLNPGGSVNDRIGLRMIQEAERRGWLKPGGTIVEPTTGNTGVALAMAAAVKGYRTVFVLPDKVSGEKIALLRAYGAEVVTTPSSADRDAPQSYYAVADRLTREIPNAFQPNQFFNPQNYRAHYATTGPEIWEQSAGRVTHLVASVGTGGTITGAGRFLKERNPAIQVVGADPDGSIYTSGDTPTHHYQVEGAGEEFWPGTLERTLIDRWVAVADGDSFQMARRLTREEGILAGGSSGMAAHVAVALAQELDNPEASIVVILPDSGRGYLSKIYNDDWMRENGYLHRFSTATGMLMGGLVEARTGGVPHVVAVGCDQTVRAAIELLREYEVSQLPVVREAGEDRTRDCLGPQPGEAVYVEGIIGSLQERTLLDHIFRDPAVLNATVRSVMDDPFELVDASEEVEAVIPKLASATPAVTVQRDGILIGVITRADLLEYVARQRQGR